jgi:hypothetical protein
MDRHSQDISYLSQDRTRSKAGSRASRGNYRRSRDNAGRRGPSVSSVEPEIRPLSFDRPIEEGVDPFINVFAQVGDLALRMPDRPIARTKSSTPRVETLPIQASWRTGLALSPRSCAAQDSAGSTSVRAHLRRSGLRHRLPAKAAIAALAAQFYEEGLMVRIRLPPAASPRLARFWSPTARSRPFARVCGPGRCSAVSRDGYRAVHWRQQAGISLSGQIPVRRRR